MANILIQEFKTLKQEENDENNLFDLYGTDLSDFEAHQLEQTIKLSYSNEKYVKIEITDFNVFILLKTADGREFLDSVLYREVVSLRTGYTTGVLSITEATEENGFEVNLL